MEDFKLERVLGEGGFGKTYLAEVLNESLKKEWGNFVAIKLPSDKEKEELLKRELLVNAEVLLKLKNVGECPNIVQFLGISRYKGYYTMIMEYVDGRSLKDIEKPLSIEEALSIIDDVLCGLVRLHKAGVLHRDIKPSNILLTRENRAKLCDFGIAKLTASNEKLLSRTGSYAYVPKERLKGEKEGFSSDIYSVGITLYELLTGNSPFLGNSPGETVRNILDKEAIPPIFLNRKIGENLNEIIIASIAKDPKSRFQKAEDFFNVLRLYRKDGIKKDTYLEKEITEKPKPKMFVATGEWNEK
ncbi:MAG: serine/threonine-protein kinase [bacterium]